jgi:GMP synthase-like glutamine amidotransferase
VRVLSIVHGPLTRAGVFADEIRERGHELREWNVTEGGEPPEADAVIVFGGAMHPDEEEAFPWLRDEDVLIRRYLADGTPLLGLCLGGQLLAKASGAHVGWAREFEIGWRRVETTEAAAGDALFASLPQSFEAFQSHYHAFEVPEGAVELARNAVCSQAFRVGDRAWGLQFHPEVTFEQIQSWMDAKDEPRIDPDAILAETEGKIAAWNAFGRTLCGAFVEVAERVPA